MSHIGSVFDTLLDRLLGIRPSTDAPRGPDALVHVYLRAGRYYMEASHRTRYAEAGYWISGGRVAELDAGAADAELGDAVLRELASCRLEVAVPPRGTKLDAPLFRAMRVRSRREAMSRTLGCLVTREPPASALRFEPLRNGGTAGDDRGDAGSSEHAAELPAGSTPAEVGRAVRGALALATAAA